MRILAIYFLLMGLEPIRGQTWLETVDDALSWQSDSGRISADLSGLLDLEAYYIDQRAPGLLFGDDSFFNPRLSLFGDLHLGTRLYGFVQARFDRGFDPRSNEHGDARLDEYFVRYTPFDSPVLHLQAGKFATVVGNWVERHSSWENPFINAPLPYEHVTTLGDQAVPASPAALIARRPRDDLKALWVPLLWGPAYTAGVSVFGTINQWDYAAEFKNASISSRPSTWKPTTTQWRHPTLSARIGFRPNAAWNFGVSASGGAYLVPAAQSTLPAGRDPGDYWQMTIGHDVRWAWHKLQIWGEVFLARFEAPNTENAETLAYYLEAKYKVADGWFIAARWNHMLFNRISDGLGRRQPWDNNAWRTDLAVGRRFSRHLQAKIQYAYNHQDGGHQQGAQFVAAQVTLKF